MFVDEASVLDNPDSKFEAEEAAGVEVRGSLDIDRSLVDSPELKETVEVVMMVDDPEKMTVLVSIAGSPEFNSEDEAITEPLIMVDTDPKDMLADDETTDDNPDIEIVAEELGEFNAEVKVDVVGALTDDTDPLDISGLTDERLEGAPEIVTLVGISKLGVRADVGKALADVGDIPIADDIGGKVTLDCDNEPIVEPEIIPAVDPKGILVDKETMDEDPEVGIPAEEPVEIDSEETLDIL